MKILKLFTTAVLAVVLWGCASAKVSVEVDLYDEDPRVLLPPPPQDNMELYAQAQVLLQEASANKNASQQWKSEVLNIYKSLWLSAGGSKTEAIAEKKKEIKADIEANQTSCNTAEFLSHPLQNLSATIINNNTCEETSIEVLANELQQL